MFKHIEKKHQRNLNPTENSTKMDENNDVTVISNTNNEKAVKKSCQTCDEVITGTMYDHMKTKHGGVSLKVEPKLNLEKTYKKRCTTCKLVVIGNTEKLRTHAKSCKLYGKFLKVTSVGYECTNCPGKLFKVKENFFHHIEIKHLGNQPQQKSPETQKNPEKKPGQWQKCENCQEMILANGNFGKHYNSCRLYSRFFKKSSDGYLYECLKCPEKRLEREKMIHHIIGNHLKSKSQQQRSDEQKIKSDLAFTIPPNPDTNADNSAKENIDAQFFKQTSNG